LAVETRLDGVRYADRLALRVESPELHRLVPQRLWLGVAPPGAMTGAILPVEEADEPWRLIETEDSRAAALKVVAERNWVELRVPHSSGRFDVPIRLRRGEIEHELTLVGFAMAAEGISPSEESR
jgi:hypothetical protein